MPAAVRPGRLVAVDGRARHAGRRCRIRRYVGRAAGFDGHGLLDDGLASERAGAEGEAERGDQDERFHGGGSGTKEVKGNASAVPTPPSADGCVLAPAISRYLYEEISIRLPSGSRQ